ncbi:TetR/AcrR family transcriptional regulator [Cellulomonas shaoxiangyii]|uniref:TetR/AcrR family transcriptional regulator n=1 Tax=Cellulomonas shaoxiangyii TaxID=2566013 RepID=A0A4P7SK85_9CELL|nr:TetR/AcrR family transcriptional regulator [Cellulomonas shaoxiangyii]QCB94148.1 TetR/AcrR family transcriptional regulator [Cellulomonas shaoxiangyii]TGY86641.1 TetR/AcrR family transcriptional regulator [Cellulomonas shaoxiangyii]
MTDDADGAAARTLRRDAQRNRERIVEAAQALYAERGLAVGFNEIAHRAGVGVGTVYNRFPDKDELIRAALQQPALEVLRVAEHARGAERASDGLVLLLDQIAVLLAANLGLRDIALTFDEHTVPEPGHAIATVIADLLARAAAEGDLRDGVTIHDLVVVLWMVTEVARHSPRHPALYRRYLQLLTDGMTTGGPPLDVPSAPDATGPLSQHWAARGR